MTPSFAHAHLDTCTHWTTHSPTIKLWEVPPSHRQVHRLPKPSPACPSHPPSTSAHLWLYCQRSSSFRWPRSQCGQPCISWLAGFFWIISLKGPDATTLFSSAEKVITASWCLLNAPTSAWVDSLPAYLLLCDDVVCTSPPPCPLLATASFFFSLLLLFAA